MTSAEFITIWDTGPAATITPSLDDVAAILRARTRSDSTGGELGTFDATTRPTAAAVKNYIERAATYVALKLPSTVPATVVGFVREIVAIRAAMRVELSYDPDRTGDGTAYDRLKEEFDDGLAALLDALDDTGEGVTQRISSIDVTSPTLAPYPAEIRELLAPPWPVP